MGLVRIVGGALRGRRLRVPDRGVRPTSERTREAVFDMLGGRVAGARVLDLYAGTGALGIEAISRGAASADLVDGSHAVIRALEANVTRLKVADRARVLLAPLDPAAIPQGLHGPWDLVFLDPPYDGDSGSRWLAVLAAAAWPPDGGLVVLERRKGTLDAPEGLSLLTERRYGDTVVDIFQAGPGQARAKGGA